MTKVLKFLKKAWSKIVWAWKAFAILVVTTEFQLAFPWGVFSILALVERGFVTFTLWAIWTIVCIVNIVKTLKK